MKNIPLCFVVLFTCFTSTNITAASVTLGPYPMVISDINHAQSRVLQKVTSNDNRRVVFGADIGQASDHAIYVVPTNGGAPVRLSLDRPVAYPYDFYAESPYITQNSRRVLFNQVTTTSQNSHGLYVSPITASSPPLELFESEDEFKWWPSADDEDVYIWENLTRISIVPIRGGSYQVVAELPSGVEWKDTLIEPTSGRVTDGDQIIGFGTDNNIYRFVFGQSSTLFTKINVSDLQNFALFPFGETQLSPDGTHLLLRDSRSKALHTLSIETGLLHNVSPRVNVEQTFRAFSFTPDSSRVVYVSDRLAKFKFEIFSATLDGSRIDNLTPANISRFGIDRELRFLGSSGQVIFQGLFTNHVYRAPIDGGAAAEFICDCPIAKIDGLDDSVETVILLKDNGLYYYSATQGLLAIMPDYKQGHLSALTRVVFVRWIKPNKSLFFAVKRLDDEGLGDVTLYRASLNRNGANTASLFETRTISHRCPGVSEYVFPHNSDSVILGVNNKSCAKLAYFKVATDDRSVSQVSKYVSAPTFCNSNDIRFDFEQDAFFGSNIACNGPSNNVAFSPRGTHIYLPANRRGIGFWGIDLRREIKVDETLCFPVKTHNKAVTQICF